VRKRELALLWVGITGVLLNGAASGVYAESNEKPAVVSSLSAQLYGYIRLDAAFDTTRIYPGNYALWVKSFSGSRGNDNQLNITANQSRIGLNLNGPEWRGGKTGGKIEFDFYGGGPENKSALMMRHAYFEINWPASEFGILAGQTWDVVAPLAPDTVNFLVCATAGEIGYRRPQLRLSQGIGLGGESKLTLNASVSREIGETLTGLTYTESTNPAFQGSVALTAPLLTRKPMMLALSGLRGKEEFDTTPAKTYEVYDSWAVSLDLMLPVVDGVTLKANAWKGSNLDAYLGGILQGVNAVENEAINCRGGWVSLNVVPKVGTQCNAGASIDAPEAGQVPVDGRTQNSVIFANVIQSLNNTFQAAFELSYWKTLYKDADSGNSLRYQAALVYNF